MAHQNPLFIIGIFLLILERWGFHDHIFSSGENMYDFTYVENVAHAHVCAEQALDPAKCYGDDVAAGKVRIK